MQTLRSSGRCSQKNYLKFSHVCLVTNYSPDVNHCCCIQQNLVMCCPYRQTWNHFRCLDSVDTVGEVESPLPGHYDVTFTFSVVIGCLVVGAVASYFVLLLRKRLLKGHWCYAGDVITSQGREAEIHPKFLERHVTSRHPERSRQQPLEERPRKNPSSSSSSSPDHRVEDVTSSSSAKNLISPRRAEVERCRYQSTDDSRMAGVDFVILDCRDSTEVWQKPQKVKVIKLTRFQDGSSLL